MNVRRMLAGLVAGAACGAAVVVGLALALTFSDADNRLVVRIWLDQQAERRGCDDFGARWSDDRPWADRICLGVPRSELAPGHVVTRADLSGVWLPVDYVPEGVVHDPSGRVVTRRLLPQDRVREERVDPVAP